MSVLSSAQLRERIYHRSSERRLVITPLLDASKQVAKAAVDVRLSSEFLVLQQTRLSGLMLDALDEGMDQSEFALHVSEAVEETTDRTYVPIGSAFVLHPGQFVLTATLEYLSLPRDLMAYVVGRSSWGRLGLNIATATMVAPGFKGSITFEMVNLGTVPIGLYPGVRIAQLVFHSLGADETLDYGSSDSKYIVPVGPEFSRIAHDADWGLLRRFVSGIGQPNNKRSSSTRESHSKSKRQTRSSQ